MTLDEDEGQASGFAGALERYFADVKNLSYDNFSSFMSDLDPGLALQERDKNLKAFQPASEVTFVFDVLGNTFLSFETEKKEALKIFGAPDSEFKNKPGWFLSALAKDQKERYRKLQAGQLTGDDLIFSVTSQEHQFLIKAVKVEKTKDRLKIKWTELSKEEQIRHFSKNSKLPSVVHVLVVNHKLFNAEAEARWTSIKEKLIQRSKDQKIASVVPPKIIIISTKRYSDLEERAFAAYVDDIFFKPMDRSYSLQKFREMFPGLKEIGDPIESKSVENHEVIKVASPISVTEISEAGFVMNYYRPIHLGSFREMVLWAPYEIGSPELLATCNYTEEIAGKEKSYKCHFVFYGITDFFLKHIRVWIRDNYVQSKEGAKGG